MAYEPLLPPWGWNPAQTFQTAYIAEQENRRAQEEFEVGMELERFLLPMKKQQAQLALEKMNLEMEKTKGELTRQTLFTRMATDAYRNTNRGVNSAVAGNGGSSNQAPASEYQSRFGFGSKLKPPAASAPQAAQPTTRKVGSGLMPKNS
jgi:hypothetical protein